MALSVLSNLDFGGVRRIVNLPDPTDNLHAVNKQYLDNALASLARGLNWKDNVRVMATGNVNIASPPSTLDGVTLAVNDRILLASQTDAKENGIYVYNGSGQALTRSSDANTTDSLIGAVVLVTEGTVNAGTAWRQTTPVPIIGTNNIVWEAFGSVSQATETTSGIIRIATQTEVNAGTIDNAAVTPLKLATYTARIRKFSGTFGDTSNTIYDIAHNMGTDVVVAAVYYASTNKLAWCDITLLDSNTIRVTLEAPPGTNALRIVGFGAL